jgi:hypothetical protein
MHFETIPRHVRRLAAEWLGRLLNHLAALGDDARRGLVAAVTRAVGETVERAVATAVIGPPRRALATNRVDPDESAWGDDAEDFDEEQDEEPVYPAQDPPRLPSRWRLVVATALSGLATWLGLAGPTSLATAAAVAAGAILLVVG